MGDVAAALRAYKALLADQERVLGPDHPETLTARHNIAMWTKQHGDKRVSVEQLAAVYEDRKRVLGPDHLDTVITRNCIIAASNSALVMTIILVNDSSSRAARLGPTPGSKPTKRRQRRSRLGATYSARPHGDRQGRMRLIGGTPYWTICARPPTILWKPGPVRIRRSGAGRLLIASHAAARPAGAPDG